MAEKIKASENKAKDVETKSKLKELYARLGKAVFEREKLTIELNEKSKLCNELATEIERMIQWQKDLNLTVRHGG